MSNGKKLVALSVLTFIALIVVGAMFNHHTGDATGTATGVAADSFAKGVQISQVGVNQLANEAGHARVSINFMWTLMTGFLVLFMQVGFAMLVTGLTRAKNASHMMMMNIAAFAIAFVAYYVVGFAFQFGGIAPIANLGGVAPLSHLFPTGNWGLIGLKGFFLQSGHTYDVGTACLFLFEVVFMETAGYIIVGAIAERISFAGFIFAEICIGAVIYPIFGNWVWGGGFLAHLGQTYHLGHGAVDFAGSGVVHATGGWAALALAIVLGPRIGKFDKDGRPHAFPGHNIGYVVLGTLILVFGWMGFNPGSTLGGTDLRISIVAVNTLLAACFGFIVAMAVTNWTQGKPDISMSCNGMLAGLVAVTAPCAFIAPWAAALIGTMAGFIVVGSVYFWDRMKVDDPCGAISVHGVCGAFGVLCTGIFADGTYGAGWNGVAGNVKGLLYGDFGQFGAQVVDVVVGFIWAFGMMFILFSIWKMFAQVRVSPEAEIEGLDVPEFGAACYPDFVLHQSSGALRPDEVAATKPRSSQSSESVS